MSDQIEDKVTSAATAVMKALEPLSPEERARVLQSAAALFGIAPSAASRSSPSNGHVVDDLGNNPEASDRSGKRLSIVEFLETKKPATNSQRIAAFAFYREHVEGKANFSRSDLEHYFAVAKLPKPGNYDRDFSGAAREGWIHEDGTESYLTQKGESAVKAGFDGKAKPRGATQPKQK
jgi:hypothetical protein